MQKVYELLFFFIGFIVVTLIGLLLSGCLSVGAQVAITAADQFVLRPILREVATSEQQQEKDRR